MRKENDPVRNWVKNIDRNARPLYGEVARSLVNAISDGTLMPGQRLPTQRELAEMIGCATPTITQALKEVARGGLIDSNVRRGTFISSRSAATTLARQEQMLPPKMFLAPLMPHLPTTAQYVSQRPEELQDARLYGYEPYSATSAGVEPPDVADATRLYENPFDFHLLGQRWLDFIGVKLPGLATMGTHGLHHGLYVALRVLTRPGDVILAEEFAYSGIRKIAAPLGLTVRGVTLNEDGIDPDEVDEFARAAGAKALIINPVLHAPTCITYSEKYRAKLAAVATRHAMHVIECDPYRSPSESHPETVVSRLSGLGIYLSTVSKLVSPGFRVGFLSCGEELAPRMRQMIGASLQLPSPFAFGLLGTMLQDGRMADLVAAQHAMAARRQGLLKAYLGQWLVRQAPRFFHAWLRLPERWNSDEFCAEAMLHGIVLSPTSAYAYRSTKPSQYLRVATGTISADEDYQRALTLLKQRLSGVLPTHVMV